MDQGPRLKGCPPVHIGPPARSPPVRCGTGRLLRHAPPALLHIERPPMILAKIFGGVSVVISFVSFAAPVRRQLRGAVGDWLTFTTTRRRTTDRSDHVWKAYWDNRLTGRVSILPLTRYDAAQRDRTVAANAPGSNSGLNCGQIGGVKSAVNARLALRISHLSAASGPYARAIGDGAIGREVPAPCCLV